MKAIKTIFLIFVSLSFFDCSTYSFKRALRNNDISQIEYLFENTKVDYSNKNYKTPPLISAIENDDVIMLKVLIKKGFDLNQEFENYPNPLQYALFNKKYKTASELIVQGAQINDRLFKLIEHLIYNKQNDLIINAAITREEFLNSKTKFMNFDSYDIELPFPLWLARERKTEVLLQLLKNWEKFNFYDSNKNDVFHYAAMYLNSEMLEYLIGNNYNMDSLNKYGETPLITASQENNWVNVLYLINSDCDIHIKTAYRDNILNSIVQEYEAQNSVQVTEIINELVDKGIDINNCGNGHCWDRFGTPLMIAVTQLELELVKNLVNHGVNILEEYSYDGEERSHPAVPQSYYFNATVFDMIDDMIRTESIKDEKLDELRKIEAFLKNKLGT